MTWQEGIQFLMFDPMKIDIPYDAISEYILQYVNNYGFYINIEVLTPNAQKLNVGVMCQYKTNDLSIILTN